ncbi:hypothetical protein AJ80_05437 [Polytolypa hystricis UAMH7299]|uniref:Uncharacterized protein n=1 Tax=Polytolypa hystricis (strain UAMH7299) TaxID=1447883 RepID=A0A2B7Y3K8_POLH7|nr:hypothetical protein AJ80_05437 [Polytolypa hystricis UAMH7299]
MTVDDISNQYDNDAANHARRKRNAIQKTVDRQASPEQIPLTMKNLERFNRPPELAALSSGTPTEVSTAYREFLEQKHANRTPYYRTPSPSPPSDSPIARVRERPRSIDTLQTKHEPHRCSLGINCLLEIENLNYHRIMATCLVSRARKAHLPVQALNHERDYADIVSLKCLSKYASELLLDKYQFNLRSLANMASLLGPGKLMTSGTDRLHPVAILREIQSPEFWDAERRYLESLGCLAERQNKSASMASTKTSLSDDQPVKWNPTEMFLRRICPQVSMDWTDSGTQHPTVQDPRRTAQSRTYNTENTKNTALTTKIKPTITPGVSPQIHGPTRFIKRKSSLIKPLPTDNVPHSITLLARQRRTGKHSRHYPNPSASSKVSELKKKPRTRRDDVAQRSVQKLQPASHTATKLTNSQNASSGIWNQVKVPTGALLEQYLRHVTHPWNKILLGRE